MKKFILLIFCLGLFGCATVQSFGEKSRLLKIGMTKNEVTQILGVPKTTSVRKLDDGVEERWMYWSKKMVGYVVFDDPNMAGPSNRLVATFENDLLQSWGDQLDLTNMMGQTTENMKEVVENMKPIQVELKSGEAGNGSKTK